MDKKPFTFMPEEWMNGSPRFIVWYTGTLGQAEWLISHSESLRGHSVPIERPKKFEKFVEEHPEHARKMGFLFALEDPDLVISKIDGTPLMSIEITEQQPFGSNGQQRMARFWSAVANRIPSAYLLPIEGYEIENINTQSGAVKAYKEMEPKKREVLLLAEQLKHLRGKSVWNAGIRSGAELILQIGLLSRNLTSEKQSELNRFVNQHILQNGKLNHVRKVDTDEFIHNLEGQPGQERFQKAYIREPGDPGTMLLTWFRNADYTTPTAAFHTPTEYKNLFRTNGIMHTIQDEKYPHLSYRNLPPAPGSSEPFVKSLAQDEISLFFKMVDASVLESKATGLGREVLTEPGVYFPESGEPTWTRQISLIEELLRDGSGDLLASKKLIQDSLESITNRGDLINELLSVHKTYNIMKIQCNANRQLSDPYSGKLAVRDVLFTRNKEEIEQGNFCEFKRNSGLIFWVDLGGVAASKHDFIEKRLINLHASKFGASKITPQEALIKLVNNVPAYLVPKDIRAHILFSDLIVVRRLHREKMITELVAGIPTLLNQGKINKKAVFLESLQAPK